MHLGAKQRAFFFIIAYLFFICLLDYPYAARLYNTYIQGRCITAYKRDLNTIDNLAAAKEEAKRYNRSLNTGVGSIRDAFLPSGEGADEYLSLLSVNRDFTMGYLYIPKIQLELPIYHGTGEETLQKGVGHLEGSSLPVGGRGTHACLSAHRGLPDKRMFTNLDLLKEGDTFFITVLDETLAYRIFDIRTVLPKDITPLGIKAGEDLVTLITCTPYGINTHRLYVTGRRIPFKQMTKKEEVPPKNWWTLNWYIPVTVILIILMFILLYRYLHSQKTPDKIRKKNHIQENIK